MFLNVDRYMDFSNVTIYGKAFQPFTDLRYAQTILRYFTATHNRKKLTMTCISKNDAV